MSSREELKVAGSGNFIYDLIEAERAAGEVREVMTRFPPEPNGYLHIGHAKAIYINFMTAHKFGGRCRLRFDDTNPAKEETRYVDAICEDIAWLGFDWGEASFASDYFEEIYVGAVELIKRGKAYVDSLDAEAIRKYRGTLTEPGIDSPWRERSIAENLELFTGMRKGDYPEGSHVLRAKIEMSHPNLNLRDPILYRILKVPHHRTGDNWCIYPMYDFAQSLCDAIEGITHSLCSLEFEDHRPLYDWFLEALNWPVPRPNQYEFARLKLTRTLMSKRYLHALVTTGLVSGWDDPRMPTLSAMRRRGISSAALRKFCESLGAAKRNSEVEISMLDFYIREDLNLTAERRMAVLEPLKVVLTNYPKGEFESFEAENLPTDPESSSRMLSFGRELYIERRDFSEDPPKNFFRLAPGREVRLKHAYYIRCDEVIKDEAGDIIELRCSYDPSSRGGSSPDGRKVKGTLHWVSAAHAIPAELRHYDFLLKEDTDSEAPIEARFNSDSVKSLNALVEPALLEASAGERFQFLRQGYYCLDRDSKPGKPVFNRTLGLVGAGRANS
jgi:glutaminyl-tRNA synthetase